jgi:uncharacterized membrane protein HdeD (DUF308 family)
LGSVSLTIEDAAAFSLEVRDFALFLLSLSILVLYSTRQDWLSILHQSDRDALRSPVHTTLCAALVAVCLTLLANGLRTGRAVSIIFSILQIVTGINNLRYNFKKELKPKEWWLQHLNGLFGDLYTNYSTVLWVATGVIGGVAIGFVSRHYKQQFGGAWLIKKASIRSELFS